jgi:NADH dehydrogenase
VGAQVLVNTYWIRFDLGRNTQTRAVEYTRRLIAAAVKAGVQRIVHISITNPSLDSTLPYFRGKAANEAAVKGAGTSYAILRPTVLFGTEDILINNIAFLLRRFPVFFIPGDGGYQLQPIYVDDMAELVEQACFQQENCVLDAVGPETFTFRELVSAIGRAIRRSRRLVAVPPRVALLAAQGLGALLGDVLLTPQEVRGLMQNLLVSSEAPRGTTTLSDWLRRNQDSVGVRYASELRRHYAPD